MTIAERAVDLTNNDPHATGLMDSFAATVIGSGPTHQPILDPDVLGVSELPSAN